MNNIPVSLQNKIDCLHTLCSGAENQWALGAVSDDNSRVKKDKIIIPIWEKLLSARLLTSCVLMGKMYCYL